MAKKLGQILFLSEKVTREQLAAALNSQVISGCRIGTILVQMGFVSVSDVSRALSNQHAVPQVDVAQLEAIEAEALGVLSQDLCLKFRVLPLKIEGNTLHVAMLDPLRHIAGELSFKTKLSIKRYVIPELRFVYCLEKLFNIPREPRFLRTPTQENVANERRRYLEATVEAPKNTELYQKRDEWVEKAGLMFLDQYPQAEQREINDSDPLIPAVDFQADEDSPVDRMLSPAPAAQAHPQARRTAPEKAPFAVQTPPQNARESSPSIPFAKKVTESRSYSRLPVEGAKPLPPLSEGPEGESSQTPTQETPTLGPLAPLEVPGSAEPEWTEIEINTEEQTSKDALASEAPPPEDQQTISLDQLTGLNRGGAESVESAPPPSAKTVGGSGSSLKPEPGIGPDVGEFSMDAEDASEVVATSMLEVVVGKLAQVNTGAEIAHHLVEPVLENTATSILFWVRGTFAVGVWAKGIAVTLEQLQQVVYPLEMPSLIHWAWQMGVPVRGNAKQDPLYKKLANQLGVPPVGEVCVAPIFLKGKVVNLLCLQSQPAATFDENALRDLKTLADAGAKAYQQMAKRIRRG